jgi:putative ABC transport system substrate-binding protein
VVSRRDFVGAGLALASTGVLTGCGLLPSNAARPTRAIRIGTLVAGASGTSIVDPFRRTLRELGYDSSVYEPRFAEPRDERFPALAAELVAIPVDVLVATTTRTAQAARGVTSTIPIVFMAVGDPVGQGFVASLAHPGGNMTGLTSISPQLNGKRLELMKEAFPSISRVAVVFDVHDADSATELKALRAAATPLGLHLLPVAIVVDEDYDGVAETIVSDRLDAVLALGGFAMSNYTTSRLLALSQRSRLPTMFASRKLAELGGLMAYGPNADELAHRTATYVDRILKGASPSELPVEQPSRFDFAINLKTAQALGLALPQSILAQATEVVQ